MRKVILRTPRVSYLRLLLSTQFCAVHFKSGFQARIIVCKELLTFTNWIIIAPCALHDTIREELGREPISYEKFIRKSLQEENYIFLHHASHFKHKDSRRSKMLEILKNITLKRIVLI